MRIQEIVKIGQLAEKMKVKSRECFLRHPVLFEFHQFLDTHLESCRTLDNVESSVHQSSAALVLTLGCNHRLSILEYDEKKINGRYKALINEDKIAVLQLQTVETKDTLDVSQLSLCPGVLESEVLETYDVSKFLIEKVEEEIVFR